MTTVESPLSPNQPVRGTRKRLDHIDAMRPVKQAGVVSTHTLLFFAPVAAGLTVAAALIPAEGAQKASGATGESFYYKAG